MTPADTSFQTIVMWVAALSTLVNFGIVMWAIFSGPSKRNASKLTELEARVSAQDTELQRLRDKVEAMPNASMLHRLELALMKMEGHIDRLDERLKPVTAIAERMQDLLIEQGKK